MTADVRRIGAGLLEPLRTGRMPSDGYLGAAALAALAACAISPAAVGAGPIVCPFRLATGLPCPACGSTRAWVLAVHGDVAGAAAQNTWALALLGAVALAAAWRAASAVSRRVPAPDVAAWLQLRAVHAVVLVWLLWGAARALGAG